MLLVVVGCVRSAQPQRCSLSLLLLPNYLHWLDGRHGTPKRPCVLLHTHKKHTTTQRQRQQQHTDGEESLQEFQRQCGRCDAQGIEFRICRSTVLTSDCIVRCIAIVSLWLSAADG